MDEIDNQQPEIKTDGTQNSIQVWDRQLNQAVDIPRDQLAQFATDPRYALKKGVQIDVVSPEGDLVTIPSEQFKSAITEGGFRPTTSEELRQFQVNKEFGDREASAAMAGIARGLTAGLSDVALTQTGLVAPETLAGLQEASPVISGVTEAAGAIAPIAATVLTGGTAAAPIAGARGLAARALAATPAGMIAKAGAATTAAVERALVKEGASKAVAKSLIQKLAPAIAGSAVEGAAYGAGQLLSEDALGKAELNAENLLAHVGTGAILGGAFGAGGELVGVAGSKLTSSVKKALSKGPLEGFTNPQKALVKLMHPGEPIERAIRDYTPAELERMVQLTRESGAIKPIMSREQVLSNLDNQVSTLGNELKSIKAVGTDAAKAAGVDYSSTSVYKNLADAVEEKYIKPMGLFADDFTDAQIKALNKVPVKKLKTDADLLINENARLSQQMAADLPELELQKLQLKVEKNNLKLTKLEDTIDKAEKVQKGLFASTSANAEVKAAQEVIKDLNLAAKSMRDMPLDVLHKEMRTIDNELEKAYKSGNFTIKQDILKTVRDGYRAQYNNKVEELVQKGLMPNNLGADLLQKNNDFHLLTTMRDTYLKNMRAGKEFSTANLLLGAAGIGASAHFGAHPLAIGAVATKMFIDSDFRRRLAVSGFMENANNSIGKTLSKAASAIGTTNKIVTRGIPAAAGFSASPLAVFENKKPKDEKEAYKNIAANLNTFADTNKALDYANNRTLKLATFAPKTAAAMDAKIISGMDFLRSKLPKTAPRGFAQKDMGIPRDSEMQLFKRYHESVMNPEYAIHAVITGVAGRPEIETLQQVYPEIWQQLATDSSAKAVESAVQPTYKQRQMLTKVTKAPADSSYNTKVIKNLQKSFMPVQKPGPGPQTTNIQMTNKYGTDMQRILSGKSK